MVTHKQLELYMKRLLAMLTLLVLSACSTVQDLRTPENLVTFKSELDYAAAYRIMMKGFQACDYASVVTGEIFPDVKEAAISSRFITGGGYMPPQVFYVVEIKAVNQGSSIDIYQAARFSEKRIPIVKAWLAGGRECNLENGWSPVQWNGKF
jgi:hypothetical protein